MADADQKVESWLLELEDWSSTGQLSDRFPRRSRYARPHWDVKVNVIGRLRPLNRPFCHVHERGRFGIGSPFASTCSSVSRLLLIGMT